MYISTCVFPMWRGGICTYVFYLESCVSLLEGCMHTCVIPIGWYICTVVSRKYAPPFATLASVQNAGGGACMRDATISLAIRPPLPVQIKHDLIVGGG